MTLTAPNVRHFKFVVLDHTAHPFQSIRAKICDEVDGYSASSDYWLRCLYEGGKGDAGDVEEGFLKGRLLVKTFKLIFTSPSSAEDVHCVRGHRSHRRESREMGPPKRPNNAEKHGMDGRVTPRAIAYAAVHLHFSLTDATHWMSQYNGFNYEEFWEFVVDYFEADETAEAREASTNFSSGGTTPQKLNGPSQKL